MAVLTTYNKGFQNFIDGVDNIIADITEYTKENDIKGLQTLIDNFILKTNDFYRENRKLNIGVVGQVKAGKSSFLNTLLFGGMEILPKASTPKTATLTKMEYSENNTIQIEYYSAEEWEVLEENAAINSDDIANDLFREICESAKELVGMIKKNGFDPRPYLEKGSEKIKFDSYDELILNLNDYVGDDGKFTPIVKAVTLYLNKEEFKGLSIVDTPGLNDPIMSRTIRTKEFMEVCDVVFFLSQTGSFLDINDWTLLSSQLPQKGVKKLVLIGSKYDSGIMDILRVPDDDDVFGEDESHTNSIPQACKMINKKLRKRARSKVEEFAEDLKKRDSSHELIEVIKQCSEPLLVSSLSCNMAGKDQSEYSPEEKNIYSALKQFSNDMESDLRLLGNFDKVIELFNAVAEEKEDILEQKAKCFIPNAQEELKGLLQSYLNRTSMCIQLLNDNDIKQLSDQKNAIQRQMSTIKADLSIVFGEIYAKLESEKAEGVQALREVCKDYLEIKERAGSITRESSYTTGHLFWKKTHYYTYCDHYSYCLAADVIENLKKYAIDASNQVEKVFTETLQIKEIKRKLINVVINNFDLSDEKFDSSLFRIMVEENLSAIEFPIFNMDISESMNEITGKFSGELTSASQKNELSTALSNSITIIYDEICNKLNSSVKEFKNELADIENTVQDTLLTNITKELETLISQCENKDKEIESYEKYSFILENEINAIR